MSDLQIGNSLPKISAPATSETQFNSEKLENDFTVLYFYPKDNTPGCTQEGRDFAENYNQFEKLNTAIFGISKDSLQSHEKFKAKQGFPFELISDPKGEFCEAMGVFKEKSMFGKTYMGIERSTFLINQKGEILKIWKKVKVKNHIQEVLNSLEEIIKDHA